MRKYCFSSWGFIASEQFSHGRKKNFHECNDYIIKQSFNYNFIEIDKLNYEINPKNIKKGLEKYYFKFFHTKDQKEHIKKNLDLYKNTPNGLGRMIQQSNLKKMYRCFEPI